MKSPSKSLVRTNETPTFAGELEEQLTKIPDVKVERTKETTGTGPRSDSVFSSVLEPPLQLRTGWQVASTPPGRQQQSKHALER
jgi:hypothetical protein